MLVLATFSFGLSFFAYGILLVPFLLVLFLFGIAFGIFGSGLVLRFGPAAEWFIWPIPAMLSPFAGVFYPLSTLPWWMRAISRILPPSYVFEGIRAIVSGGAVSGNNRANSLEYIRRRQDTRDQTHPPGTWRADKRRRRRAKEWRESAR